MIRYLTAGESHGPMLTTIVEGLPAGLKLDIDQITHELRRRQHGYGRGRRMQIERDKAEITSGLWRGRTIGSPITIVIRNQDYKNWKNKRHQRQLVPRPGHADLAGYLKYGFDDIQPVIERASARETAARTAAGTVAKQYLACFGVKLYSHTRRIGPVVNDKPVRFTPARIRTIETSPVRCADKRIGQEMIEAIDHAIETKDTLGGVAEIVIAGVPVGLGSYVQWDRRADSRLAATLMSVPSVKAVAIGDAVAAAASAGSEVHDPIGYDKRKGFVTQSNNCGGILGGITTGAEIVLCAYFKPISTLGEPLDSMNLKSRKLTRALYVRSDTCIVPAGGVICEAAAALVFAYLFSEKFGGDSIAEALTNFRAYLKHVKSR
ncbi:MAG: chorismate synthase [candidate division Zixibacteria bacterium]|nr:chorismate synthase [candidate division Zixibacteria bacterium]